MIVLDTTILAYATGGEHPLRDPCRRIFDAATNGELDARTTTFVIQEFLHVASRRRGRRAAAASAREFTAVLAPLLRHEQEHVTDALDLYEAHERLGAFDAFLAAAVRAVGATLVSADRAFADVSGLSYVDPASPELAELLGE